MSRPGTSGRRLSIAAAVLGGLVFSMPASASAAAPSTVVYRVTFTGSGGLVSTVGDAGSGTSGFTTSFSWTLVYRVELRLPDGLPAARSLYPGEGSSVSGSSVGAVDSGTTTTNQGCERSPVTLTSGEKGSSWVGQSRGHPRFSFVVPAFGGLVRFGDCDAQAIAQAAATVCAKGTIGSVFVALNPVYTWQRWSVTRTCANGHTKGHWKGVIRAVRIPG